MVTGVPDDHAGADEPQVPDAAGALGVPGGSTRPEPAGPTPPPVAGGGRAQPTAGGSAGDAPVDPARLSDVELAMALVDGRVRVDATTARWVLLLGEFDRRSLWLADGAVSPAAWLRRECRINAPTSTHLLTVARALRELPATREAFTAGAISFEHVRAIAPALGGSGGSAGDRRPDPRGSGRLDLARRADPIFARAAAWMTPRQVARVVSTWIDIADT